MCPRIMLELFDIIVELIETANLFKKFFPTHVHIVQTEQKITIIFPLYPVAIYSQIRIFHLFRI